MPVTVSYPGVYVQEIPSGVRTIVGVGTSIGMFLGRTRTGEINRPVQCLNYEDFVRNFGPEATESDVPRAVRLFFTNGGTQCYVMRIAKGATAATVTLHNEAKVATLVAEARSAGTFGDDIRLAVSYNTTQPESTFNLEAFRWQKNSSGALVKTAVETYVGVSMDPASARYAVDLVNTQSALIRLTNLSVAPAANGWSQSGYAISATDAGTAHAQWLGLIGTTQTSTFFRISVDGNAAVEVSLKDIDLSNPPWDAAGAVAAMAPAGVPARIAQLINEKLPAGASVTVAFVAGPAGPAANPNSASHYLRITSNTGGDVVITPASSNDLASRLMLGTAAGGREVSRFAGTRPAPNGYVMTLAEIEAFAAQRQNSFNKVRIDGVEIDLSAAPYRLATTGGGVVEPRMYQDATASTQNNGRAGLREKLGIIAAAIANQRAADSSFGYTAEVWGDRLAIIPVQGSDNVKAGVEKLNGAIVVAPPLKVATDVNTRYASLNANGSVPFQSAGAGGNDGVKPEASDYEAAFNVIDKEVDLFNIMVLPKDKDASESDMRKLWGPASVFCQRRRAFLLIDPPASWTDSQKATDASVGVNTLRVGLVKDHAAVYYPNLKIDENGKEIIVAPSGAIAGVMARIDGTRGVWKAPAGTEADLRGVIGVERRFSDGENGVMNPKAVNTIRVFPNGIVSWGARTMDGDDGFGSEYKYVPIRRLALFLEESLYRGLKWVVFEPNDEPLWGQIRLNVGAFMHNQFRQGAFQGTTPKDAYFVKCDAGTTTQNDRNLGIVNIVVGFAPLKPAEFVVLYLQQMAGQIQT
jgi:phage tail sheath protein FI